MESNAFLPHSFKWHRKQLEAQGLIRVSIPEKAGKIA